MNKEEILNEIRRTAKENGGLPLGKLRFFKETSIKEHECIGKYWVRWGDAVAEAGFSPNKLQVSYDEEKLFEKYIGLTRRLGRLPVPGDLLLETRNDPDFPHEATYRARYGSKSALVAKLVQYCQCRSNYEDVIEFCKAYSPKGKDDAQLGLTGTKLGYVYLLKHGSRREYKIGKTFNPVRREGEITLQLPEKIQPVHYIKTDDPSGIEAYWHSRFADKRKEGEWFELNASDVQTFKRWKRIL